MAPEHDKKRAGRKLLKKRKTKRSSSLQYPDRLKFRDGEDAHEDVTASKGQPPQHLNQSVFSMIAAAGSKVDFHARFEEGSSDSEEGEDLSSGDIDHGDCFPREHEDEKANLSPVAEKPNQRCDEFPADKTERFLPKSKLRTIEEKGCISETSQLSSDELMPPVSSPSNMTPRNAPVMSMMLHAQAQLISSNMDTQTRIDQSGIPGGTVEPSNLATRLKEIFGFEEPEEVISGMWE